MGRLTDAQDIERAYRMIEGYVGDGDVPSRDTDLALFLAEMRREVDPEVWAEFDECSLWAVGIAWKRYLADWAVDKPKDINDN